jgi:ligand-binding sensor domain-containing protein
MLKTGLLFCTLVFCLDLHSQDFSYTRYDIKDGLAGSSVFCAAQDKEGFMWFGTESGLSRFDGIHFKNFTAEDGLPDNEIIGLFCDSKGRIWMMPFRNSICYYYKGKLHTQQTDPLLSKFQLTSNLFFIAEDKSGNLAFAELSRIHLLKDTSISTITVTSNFTVAAMGIDSSGKIQVYISPGLFHIKDDKLVPSNHKKKIYNIGEIALGKTFFVGRRSLAPHTHTDFGKFNLTFSKTDSGHLFKATPGHINFSILSDSLFADNTNNGAMIYNCNNAVYREHHLPGKSVSSVFLDNEKNLWFCTQREGVYKLNSPFVLGHRFIGNNKQLSVHSLCWYKGNLWVGTEDGYVFTFDPVTGSAVIPPKTSDSMSGASNVTKVLLEIKTTDLLIGRQKQIQALSGLSNAQTGSLKDIRPAYENNVLVSTSNGVWLMDVLTFKVGETIWNGRATTAHYSGGLFYIGTLDGLYIVTKQKEIYFAGNDDPLLKSKIAAIRESPDGTLWIATNDRGIIKYKNRKVLAHITTEQGLSSNICRCLFSRDNQLWAGTDKGLHKIETETYAYTITKYTAADGLVSDFINCVYADDSLVYVGTPEGISYFDDKKISHQTPCILRLTDIAVSGGSIAPGSRHFSLERRSNNIRFEYAGISYRSGGEISYRYKLSGLDTSWRITKENFLSYPILSPGDYVMELQAINKFGIESEIISIPFSIKKFWWEEIWMQIFGIIFFLFIAGIVVNWRIRQVRLREKEKNLLREKISLQEQMALKAQMNPHFIFNSLNSIQHYVLDKDIVGANKYIAGFSRLIRLTLDNSSKPEISIEEEIKYLSQYLEMEKMRTDNKFNYSIHVPEEIFNNGHSISPMILQPFIENSIRHGLRYRNDSNGHIKIEVSQYEKGLKYLIEDNGVGRFIAGAFKSKNPIEYQSKGISLTEQRINSMNINRKEKIEIEITDVEYEGTIKGTRVIIIYPTTNKKTHDQSSTG